LLSRTAIPTGLGNQNGLVGRFFMEHLYLESGDLVLSSGDTSSGLYSIHPSDRFGARTKIEGVLTVSERIQERERLLRCGFHFPPRWRTGPAFNSQAVTSLIYLVRLARLGHMPYRWQEHARTTIGGFRNVLVATHGRVLGRRFASNSMAMRAFAEQAPNPDSRILLSDKRDRLGRNLVRIDWKLSDADLRSIRLSHEILAAELERSGVGFADAQLDSADAIWPERLRGGYHQMGTTRMHTDARQGVVDANCRLHSTSNVYVAGGSVFPTGGYANPTLSIVALAIRLADHLKGLMS